MFELTKSETIDLIVMAEHELEKSVTRLQRETDETFIAFYIKDVDRYLRLVNRLRQTIGLKDYETIHPSVKK